MSALDSNLMKQATLDMFNMVRGREAPAKDARKSDTPPRLKKMTLKDLEKQRGRSPSFDMK